MVGWIWVLCYDADCLLFVVGFDLLFRCLVLVGDTFGICCWLLPVLPCGCGLFCGCILLFICGGCVMIGVWFAFDFRLRLFS